MKNILLGVLIFVLVIFGSLGLKALLFPVATVSKSLDMGYEVVDKTLTGENAIYNYEYFKKQAESIKALRSKETRADGEINEFYELYGKDTALWTRDDKTEHSRLQANLTGVQNMLDDAMADYNAKSQMVNRAIFKDGLPSNLSRAVVDGIQLMSN